MNAQDKKMLKDIVDRLELCKGDLENLGEDLQDRIDNKPEQLVTDEETDAAETVSNAAADVESVRDNLEGLL